MLTKLCKNMSRDGNEESQVGEVLVPEVAEQKVPIENTGREENKAVKYQALKVRSVK